MADQQMLTYFQVKDFNGDHLHDIRNAMLEVLKRLAVQSGVNGQFPQSFADDMKLVVGEITGNAIKHGIHPSIQIRETEELIEMRVVNHRKPIKAEETEVKELFAEAACGRGMSFITLLIMQHPEVTIKHTHYETAQQYVAQLIIEKATLISYFKTFCSHPHTQV